MAPLRILETNGYSNRKPMLKIKMQSSMKNALPSCHAPVIMTQQSLRQEKIILSFAALPYAFFYIFYNILCPREVSLYGSLVGNHSHFS
jgi:hypothetical protein